MWDIFCTFAWPTDFDYVPAIWKKISLYEARTKRLIYALCETQPHLFVAYTIAVKTANTFAYTIAYRLSWMWNR